LLAVLAQPAQPVRGQLRLLLPRAFARRVHADHRAAERLRRVDPLVVVLDGLPPLRLVRRAQAPFAVAHDQVLVDALAVCAAVHLGQVRRVLRLVLEEAVDVLDCLDAELLPRDAHEVQVVQLARADRAVQRPLRQRDAEPGGRGVGEDEGGGAHAPGEAVRSGGAEGPKVSKDDVARSERGERAAAGGEEFAASGAVHHGLDLGADGGAFATACAVTGEWGPRGRRRARSRSAWRRPPATAHRERAGAAGFAWALVG